MGARKKREPEASFQGLPSRSHVVIELDDPRMGPDDYAPWAALRGVKDAIVKVTVRLTEASTFDPDAALRALQDAGAHHVLPIVPALPKAKAAPGERGDARLPAREAFERFVDARPLPKGLSREDVLAAFEEASGR